MSTFKNRVIAAELDEIIIPCQITNKSLCSCLDPCLVRLLVEFANRLNQIKNTTTCPPDREGTTASQSTGFFGPTTIKWQTKYQIENGCKLVLSQREMVALYNYMNTKHSKFGAIMRVVLDRQNRIWYAKNHVNCPSSTQGITISQGGYFSCTKIRHNYRRKVKSARRNDCCCEGEEKNCCHEAEGTCRETNCF